MIRLCRVLCALAALLMAAPALAGPVWWWDSFPNNTNTQTQVKDDLGQTVTLDTNRSGTENINASNSSQPPVILTNQNGTGDIIAIAAGLHHSLLLRKDGTVWGAGDNSYGQLSYSPGSYSQFKQWTQLNINLVRAIAACGNFTLVVRYDGTVWGTGDNSSGQLGLGSSGGSVSGFQEAYRSDGQPMQDVIALGCGDQHAVAITGDGALWGVGSDSNGQLGDIGSVQRWTRSASMSPAQPGATPMTTGLGVYGLDTLAATTSGVAGAGSNGSGQIGAASSGSNFSMTGAPANASQLAMGRAHSLVLSPTQGLWGAGDNTYGQLGSPGAGGNSYSQINFMPACNCGIASVAAGGNQSFLIDGNGDLYVAGDNSKGQLGLPSSTGSAAVWQQSPQVSQNALAVAAGEAHTLVLLKGGTVIAAGDDTYGQLGLATSPSGFQVTAN